VFAFVNSQQRWGGRVYVLFFSSNEVSAWPSRLRLMDILDALPSETCGGR
jgi:hypothetical protein